MLSCPFCWFTISSIKARSVFLFEDADSGGESREESELDDHDDRPFVPPPGYMMYTVFPDGSPVPQGMALYAPPPPLPNNSRPLSPGTVVYGPPPAGAPIVYGPPPPSFSVPLIPVGVLHCNVPEHHALVSGEARAPGPHGFPGAAPEPACQKCAFKADGQNPADVLLLEYCSGQKFGCQITLCT